MRHVSEIKKNKYIFVSIPKTGTNSIWDKILKPGDNYRPFQHVKAITIKNNIGSVEWNNRFSFACVRNPYKLVKSWYDYHKSHDDIIQHVKDFYPDSFEEWVMDGFKTHWEPESHKRLNPYWDGSNPLFQYKWVTDNNENFIVNHIMKIETLDVDFDVVAKKFNFDNGLNKLNQSNLNTELNDNIKNVIYTTFEKDFDLFNYKP